MTVEAVSLRNKEEGGRKKEEGRRGKEEEMNIRVRDETVSLIFIIWS